MTAKEYADLLERVSIPKEKYKKLLEQSGHLDKTYLGNQLIDLLWHLLSEDGVKEKYIKMCEGLGYSNDSAEDMFSHTDKALRYYYNETYLRLPATAPLVVGNCSE
ncbi:MAG: hypothetical protein EBR82_45025 [Caulobacteraceae bacterium]|nr:hypothetical protein [Caulobacteraceae bacterium]